MVTQNRNYIHVKGACEHNLKNIETKIPKNKLVVITGVSGSGKSSLAFDTIFAEGQRRYVESLSSYARQFLGQMEKPKYDTISGLSPTIAIEQKAASKNPRSTVGTITEVYDFLRVMYARIGTQHCHICGKVVGRGDAESMVTQLLKYAEKTKIQLLAPLVENRKGEHKEMLEGLKGQGFVRARIDGSVLDLSDIQSLAKHKKHTIEVVIDRLAIKSGPAFRKRLTGSVESALKQGKGTMIVYSEEHGDVKMSEERSCCGHAFPELDPPLFSFNSPLGMCGECNGIGTIQSIDEKKLVANTSLSLREGAVIPWANYFLKGEDDESWGVQKFRALEKGYKIDFDTPWKKLSAKHRKILLHGDKSKELTVNWKGSKSEGKYTFHFEGLIPQLMRRFRSTQSDSMKNWYSKFLSEQSCPKCGGKRLRPEVLAVSIQEKSIMDLTSLSIKDANDFIKKIRLTKSQNLIASELMKEIKSRLHFLINVGLDYLSLDRKGPTLSGGEAQRIRLASQIGSELTGVLYVLDEPSIGLHQRDNHKLLSTLKHLRDIGNSLLVVEHDQDTMEQSDWIIDMGPGAGHLGGAIIAEGTPAALKRNKKSTTGHFLAGKEEIEVPSSRRLKKIDPKYTIKIVGANENNLRNVDCSIPLSAFTCVTGVSGAGKSTLINQILYPALSAKLGGKPEKIGEHKKIEGLNHIDKIINIDQKPIGRTPRSNPATYTKVFDLIRDFYAQLPESKERGYTKGRFSFNVKGGRCENCSGDGHIKVEMHFLADVFVPCSICHGKRFNSSTLEILYKGNSIADVLDLSILEARQVFENHPKIVSTLDTLIEVGLSYVKLGQPATTLSGGEAQRIKLSRELSKKDTGKTLYLLDEPTTGLHFEDIRKLLGVLQKLVDHGNSVLVIEHNLDVIKSADWIIDVGPEGGDNGGQVVAEGIPEKVAKVKKSYTGKYLKPLLH